MVGLYILVSFALVFLLMQMVLLIISCNYLVRIVEILKDITVGVSTVMDNTKSQQKVTTASGDPSGLMDVPQPVGNYDPRFNQPS